jgi:hypothetical protein
MTIMAISKRDLTHIGFDPRPDIGRDTGPNTAGAATKMSTRRDSATGPGGGRCRIGIARRAAGTPKYPIFDDRSARDEPMTPRQDAGMFALTRAENGRSASFIVEWL